MHRIRVLVLSAGFVAGLATAALAQSHAYLAVGEGATQVTGGATWRLGNTPVGVGAEVGVGDLFVGALAAAYHPRPRADGGLVDPFVSASLMGVASSPVQASGVGIGAGVLFWGASRRFAVRIDGYRFLAASTNYDVPRDEVTARYWSVRAGAAIRLP